MLRALFVLLLLSVTPFAGAAQDSILVMGDSLSSGHGIDRDRGWVELLRQRLTAEGYDYNVVNASISGETTRGALARLPKVLKKHRPAVVILELGGNDGLRGIPPEVMRNHLSSMIEQSRAVGARVLLTGIRLPENYGPVYTKKFQAVYDVLANEYDVARVPFFMDGVALNPERMQEDGIHPNAAGQPRLLDNLWPYLEPLLERSVGTDSKPTTAAAKR